MNYVIHIANRCVVSRDATNEHIDRQYYDISSIMFDFMERKVLYYINVKFKIVVLFLCHSVSVCSI